MEPSNARLTTPKNGTYHLNRKCSGIVLEREEGLDADHRVENSRGTGRVNGREGGYADDLATDPDKDFTRGRTSIRPAGRVSEPELSRPATSRSTSRSSSSWTFRSAPSARSAVPCSRFQLLGSHLRNNISSARFLKPTKRTPICLPPNREIVRFGKFSERKLRFSERNYLSLFSHERTSNLFL